MTLKKKPQSGRLDIGVMVLAYGVPGIGKTKLGADAPRPIFFDYNKGANHYEIDRYPFDPGFAGLIAGLIDIRDNSTRDECRTIVIDTVGDVERELIWPHVCSVEKVANIEKVGGGYHKGYARALDFHREIAQVLDGCLKLGIHVLMICHEMIRKARHPDGEEYDMHDIDLCRSNNGNAAGFWRNRADIVAYLRHETGATKGETKSDRAKGWATGRRLMFFSAAAAQSATFYAKTRLPVENGFLEELHPWAPIQEVIDKLAMKPEQRVQPAPDELVIQIQRELERLAHHDDLYAKVWEHLGPNPSKETLRNTLSRLGTMT